MYKLIRKSLTFVALLSMLINSLAPFTYSLPQTFAQEVSPSPIETPVVTETPTPTGSTSSLQAETPLTTESPTPTETPTITPEATPTSSVVPTPTEQVSPTTTATTENQNNSSSNNTSEDQNNTPTQTPTVTPETTPTEAAASSSNKTGNEELNVSVLENTNVQTLNLQASNIQSSAMLTTDKADYAPTDTAVISGNNLMPKATYILFVSSTDPPAVNFSTQVTTNEQGSFTYGYQLDGNYRPNYSVELKDLTGNLIASTTFLDHSNMSVSINGGASTTSSLSATLNIGWSGNGGDPSQARYANDTTTSGSCSDLGTGTWSAWESIIDLGSNTATKSWTLASGADGTRKVCVETAHGSIGSPTGIQADNDSITYAQPATEINYNNFEGEIAPQGSGNWTNGNISGYKEGDTIRFRLDLTSDGAGSGHLFVGFTSDPACRFFKYLAPTNVSTTGSFTASLNPVLAQNGDDGVADFTITSSEATAGKLNFTLQVDDNAAACASGSSQHVQIDHTTGDVKSSGNKALPIPASAVAPVTDLSIVKTGSSAQSLNGIVTYTVVVTNLDPSTTAQGVVVTDTLPAGITYTSAVWNKTNPSGSGSCINSAQTITCTVGDLAGGATATVTITGTINNDNQLCGTTLTDIASVSTTTLESNSQNNSAFYNTNVNQCQGTIVIYKTANGGDGTFGFSLTGPSGYSSSKLITTSGGSGTTGSFVVNAGSGYSITEDTLPSDWSKDSISCDNGVQSVSNTNFTVSNGGIVACTFTNSRDKGSIELKKTWGGHESEDNTTLKIGTTVGGNEVNEKNVSSDDTTGSFNVNTGTYYLSETDLPDYNSVLSCKDDGQTVSIGDNNSISVQKNHTVVCTYTNTHKTGRVTFQKLVDDNSDVSGWTFTVNGQEFHSGDTVAFNTGEYTVTESGSASYDPYSVSGVCSNRNGSSAILTVTEEGGTCTFTNHVKRGDVVVVKYHDKNANGVQDTGEEVLNDWEIHLLPSGEVTPLSQFTGSGDPAISGQVTFSDLFPGSFTLSERAETDWYQSNIWCDNNSGTYDDKNKNYTLTLSPDETVTCKVGNYQLGHIKVVKDVVDPNGSGIADTSTSFAFNVEFDSFNLTDGENHTVDVVPGPTHVVTETPNVNYDFAGCISDAGGSALGLPQAGITVPVSSGQTVTVTCKNKQKQTTITVNKVVKNAAGQVVGNDPTSFAVRLNGEDEKLISSGNPQNYTVNPGVYTIGEVGVDTSKYEVQGCKIGEVNATEFRVVSGQGEITVTCTNQQKPGTISGTKFDNFGNVLSGWTINLFSCAGTGIGCGELPLMTTSTLTDGTYSFTGLVSGFYQIVEVMQAGWTNVWDVARDVFINPGDQLTGQDFKNNGDLSITACKYEDGNGPREGGEFTPVNNWDFTLSGQSLESNIVQNSSPESNCTTFTGLQPGSYQVTEGSKEGWFIADDSDGARNVILEDSNVTVNFFNYQKGGITGMKWNDLNGDGRRCTFTRDDGESQACESGLLQWTIFIDENDNEELDGEEISTMTGINGSYSFEDLNPGTYQVCEVILEGWNQTYPVNSTESYCHSVTVTSGTIVDGINFGNHENKITINKYDEQEQRLGGATFEVCGRNSESCFTVVDNGEGDNNQTPGIIELIGLANDSYTIRETIAPVGYVADNEGSCIRSLSSEASDKSCTFFNRRGTPVLKISKSNNTGGATMAPGNEVLYTITVTAEDADANDVRVVDLLPKGFVYKPGSWTANSDVRGNLKPGITGEPTYASPGTWQLGNMVAGETVTLTLIATIDGGQQSGKYKDIAWAQGNSALDESVLALAQPTGFVDTNFVGTDVAVSKDSNTNASISVKTGDVLGAMTELPATGANNIWVILSGMVFGSGLILTIFGVLLRKKYAKKLI